MRISITKGTPEMRIPSANVEIVTISNLVDKTCLNDLRDTKSLKDLLKVTEQLMSEVESESRFFCLEVHYAACNTRLASLIIHSRYSQKSKSGS